MKVPSMVLIGSYDTPVIVGRGSQATLNLGRINKQVSRRHAIVQWCAESSAFQITVLGQNGVRINGIGYPSGQQKSLREGDIVDLVGVKMLFRQPAEFPVQCQEYQDSVPLGSDLDQSDEESMPAGLVTPKRTPKKGPIYQLATPSHSSPIRESPQLTPNARISHKMLKYDLSSTNRSPFDSPLSDAGTEFDSSPVRSQPVFSLPVDASPVRKPIGLETPPKLDADFSTDGQFPNSPSKYSAQRTPLAPLSLSANRQSSIPKSKVVVNNMPSNPSSQLLSSPLKSKKSNLLKTLSSKSENTDIKADPTQSSVRKEQKQQKQQQHKSNTGAIETENVKPTTSKHEKSIVVKDSHTSQEVSQVKESYKVAEDAKSKVDKTKSTTLSGSSNKPTQPTKIAKEGAKKSHSLSSSAKPTNQQTEEPSEKESKQKDSEIPESGETSLSSRKSSPEEPPVDYTESIIDTLVFARKKKSMTLSELYEEMVASQPSLIASQSPEEIKEQMLQCLSSAGCVGKISRKGKDAYNKPLETQWYYIPESDHNVMRKLTRQEVMPSARKCTLKDKQYFFKMPPKLPYHRKSTSPYAVKQAVRRTKESSKLSAGIDDTEPGEESSSDPDEDSVESVLLTKRRKSANAGHVEKKRKSALIPEKAVTKDDEAEDDEDDEVQNDSLDDVSELSGLSD
ncbi:hypothetical protein BGZ49_009846 [Haplosporangium sp. Z 27]|nr:hypothetical protein BGZ49_009846 [Haplosporangium sp. Z 27]